MDERVLTSDGMKRQVAPKTITSLLEGMVERRPDRSLTVTCQCPVCDRALRLSDRVYFGVVWGHNGRPLQMGLMHAGACAYQPGVIVLPYIRDTDKDNGFFTAVNTKYLISVLFPLWDESDAPSLFGQKCMASKTALQNDSALVISAIRCIRRKKIEFQGIGPVLTHFRNEQEVVPLRLDINGYCRLVIGHQSRSQTARSSGSSSQSYVNRPRRTVFPPPRQS